MKKTMMGLLAVLGLLCGSMQHAHALSDGTPSTGSLTIATNSALASASATGSLAILSTTGLLGTQVSIGPYQLVAGRDFVVGASTAAAAASLVSAINAITALNVTAAYSAGATSISLTANSAGSLANSVTLRTSNALVLTVSGANLSGGQDNATVTINGVTLVQGRDWFKQDVASNTASNLAASINLSPKLVGIVNAQWVGGSSAVVFLRSVTTPVAYRLATSGSAITKSGTAMTGGSAGNITPYVCFLGVVNALPTSNYPRGCLAYLSSAPTKLQLSTEPVVGSQSWLAIP